MRKEAKVGRIIIPGRPIEVDLSRVHGDVGSAIRFELTGKETWFDQMPDTDTVRNTIARGGRVFITEMDEYFFVEPKKRAPQRR